MNTSSLASVLGNRPDDLSTRAQAPVSKEQESEESTERLCERTAALRLGSRPHSPLYAQALLAKEQGLDASIQLICGQTKQTLASGLGGDAQLYIGVVDDSKQTLASELAGDAQLCIDLADDSKRILASELRADAQSYIDFVDDTLDEAPADSFRRCLRALRAVCGHARLLPSSWILSNAVTGVGGLPHARGGNSDVFKATYLENPVAIKQLRTTFRDNKGLVEKKICKEVVMWKRLSQMHDNIFPFLGVTSTYPPSMVSPWMNNGCLTEYVCSHQDVNRPELLMEVCEGLKFLHFFEVVHGDLKGPNILIDDEGHARLADFGITSVISHLNSINPSSFNSRLRGTYQWMSPELLIPEMEEQADSNVPPSLKSDIYALAMVVIELFTGDAPYRKMSDPVVILRVTSGKRPPRPEGAGALGLSDTIWKVVEQCWQEKQDQRPTIFTIIKRLRGQEPA